MAIWGGRPHAATPRAVETAREPAALPSSDIHANGMALRVAAAIRQRRGRTTCDHGRMQAARAWRVEPLTPSRRDDFLAFFDHERGRAFADNPAWSGCYCHYFHVAPALWETLDASANRIAMQARIDVAEMEGYLAFDDADRVAGWLNAQPRHRAPHCFARLEIPPTPLDVPAHRAAVVLCFVIDPSLRRRGVAQALLTHALDDLRSRGIVLVDAFPARAAQSASAHFRGPAELFARSGFAPLMETDACIVMRRPLA